MQIPSRLPRRVRRVCLALLAAAAFSFVLSAALAFVLRNRPKRALRAVRWLFGRVLNPIVLWFAERFRVDQSVVYHTGRRSGREYATPLCVSSTPDGFIVPAAFGSEADWFLNLRASDEARLLHEGMTHRVRPEVIDAAEAVRLSGGTAGCPCWESMRVADFVLLRPMPESPPAEHAADALDAAPDDT